MELPVVMVVFDGFELLDLAGPSSVLRAATLLGADPGYRVLLASPDGQPVTSESGIQVTADVSLAAATRRKVHTVLVVGGQGGAALRGDPRALADLARLSARAERTTSVCTGALVLAAAGLLDGYQATTHWAFCDELAAGHPDVEVLSDRIYVHDRDRWTSAGVTAATDLALGLVEHDAGAELARSVAGWLVVFARRPGGQAQFSDRLGYQPARSPGIADVQRWLTGHLGDDLSVGVLAHRAAMSPRTFARTFRREVGTTPAVFVETQRVDAARHLLETTELTVGAVARRVGFGRVETLHRAFGRRSGTTPDRYRQHFQRSAS